jgi:DNA-directed RNA polymerase specialized sigma24 family protein
VKNPSYPHTLQAAIQDRLLQRDAAGAWAAVETLANAVLRSKVPLDQARANLAVCLGSLEFVLVAAGLGGGRRLQDRQIARRLLAAGSCDDLVKDFLTLAYTALRPALLAALVEGDRPELEAIARRRLHGPRGVDGVIQTVVAKLVKESESDPSELLAQRLEDEVDREAHNRARRRQRRTGRSVPADDIASFLGIDPSQEHDLTMNEVDEMAARVLSPKRYAVYERKRRGYEPGEIAEALQISPRTVRYRWQGALKQLREALGLQDPPRSGE